MLYFIIVPYARYIHKIRSRLQIRLCAQIFLAEASVVVLAQRERECVCRQTIEKMMNSQRMTTRNTPVTPMTSRCFVLTLLALALSLHSGVVRAFSPSARTLSRRESLSTLSLSPNVVLTDAGEKSSSGKSRIIDASLKCGKKVIVKLSPNKEALQRESENYDRIAQNEHTAGLFAKLYAHKTKIEKYPTKSALVMEKGCQDLRQYIQENGPLEGRKLRNAAGIATLCVEAVHDAKMVWTEIKAPNFIVQEDGNVLKGIDLESAVEEGANPLDFTPEACPPEFALAYMCYQEADERMMKYFDIWSLGMVFYEMANGEDYFGGEECEFKIGNALRAMDKVHWKKQDVDPVMKDLIELMLTKDPEERPTVKEVLAHPFFLG